MGCQDDYTPEVPESQDEHENRNIILRRCMDGLRAFIGVANGEWNAANSEGEETETRAGARKDKGRD